jgi:hypothetical protein
MNLLFDHLWQSTAVLAVTGLLTLFFHNNGAHVRHALWTAASLKFLAPFALLNSLGHYLSGLLTAPPVQPPMVQTLYSASQPFSDGPVFVALPAPGTYGLPVMVVWGAGTLAVLGLWFSRWLKLRAVLRAAMPSDIAAPVPVALSATLMEPGLVGIFRPVLLLSDGIAEKLMPAELQSIIAHEACHLRRRDNLTAALHMLVEAVFWFWPPVWWLGTRLIAERERACDEAVLAGGNDPQVYATSILKVCKHYISSPLACASGVSGADLKQRMEEIMRNAVIARLNLPRKALLVASAAAVLTLPMAAGIFVAPSALAQSTASGPVLQDVVKRSDGNPSPGLSEALRRNSEALLHGTPDYGLMTPRMQRSTRQSLRALLGYARQLGPVHAITFRGIDSRGWDIYDVSYQNGTATYTAVPLVDGKLDELTWGDLLLPGQPQHPGTEALLRKYVEALQNGAPDYNDMTPSLAQEVRKEYSWNRDMVKSLGAQEAITYKGGGWGGLDTFDAVYEHGKMRWIVFPLENGKLAHVGATAIDPVGSGAQAFVHVGFFVN